MAYERFNENQKDDRVRAESRRILSDSFEVDVSARGWEWATGEMEPPPREVL